MAPKKIGTGRGVAALFNGRAKQVTARLVETFRRTLPDALLLVSHDRDEARAHVRTIAKAHPRLLLSGGGDGAVVMLLNLLREEGVTPFPTLGVLRLGTGNAWARALGSPPVFMMADLIPLLHWPLPTQRFHLVEVEHQLCHFAGVGWDARILNDYKANLARRRGLLRRLHAGFGGYMWSMATRTIPKELAAGRKRHHVTIESLDGHVYRLDARAMPHKGHKGVLYDGPISIGGAATTPEFGYGIRAFPFATVMPGYLNVRLYDRPVTEALADIPRLWRGAWPEDGMHDFFVRRARFHFDRPMPFQIGGDGVGERKEILFELAEPVVDAVDWRAARAQAALV